MTAPHGGAPIGVRAGLVAGFAAYAIWGLFPLYLKQLDAASPLEIVAHRVIWSVPFGALVLTILKQWRETLAALRAPRIVLRLALAALFIAGNWLVYVWAVADGRVLQASLGYYINPLILTAMGVFILGERLSRTQMAAVALAALGVLALTIGAGVFPWPSFVLALSFSSYGFVRKTTPVGAMPGLFIEVALLAPLALGFLGLAMARGESAFVGGSMRLDALLLAAGPITIVPLALFSLAARRLKLSTMGFLQYIGPTLQFALGLYYGETFTPAHALCFALIWTALALFSFDAMRANRGERALIQSAAASPKGS